MTASEHCDQFIRDAFISGLLNNQIRQRLLEKKKELDLQTAFDEVSSIDTPLKSAKHYQTHTLASMNSHEVKKRVSLREDEKIETRDVSARLAKSCSYCEVFFHSGDGCPARNATCYKCQEEGTSLQCFSRKQECSSNSGNAIAYIGNIGLLDISEGLEKACMKISLNRNDILTLIDYGSTDNFIYHCVVKMCSLKSTNYDGY